MKKLDFIALALTLTVLRKTVSGRKMSLIAAATVYFYLKKKMTERRASSLKGKGKAFIVGAGAAGLCAAVQLKKMGVDVSVFEKHDSVGGVWNVNQYPGCCADVESYLYQFSFFPRTFSKKWAYRDELLTYLRDMTSKFNIQDSINLMHRVDEAIWDKETNLWNITVTDLTTGKSSQHSANFFIAATENKTPSGMLRDPKHPSFPTEDYEGIAMHTAEWKSNVCLKNKNVAIIGTGSSGIQAASEILKDASKLTIYMRTPPYVAPKNNVKTSSLKKYLTENSDLLSWLRRSLRQFVLDLVLRLVFAGRESFRKFITEKMFTSVMDTKISQLITNGKLQNIKKDLIIPKYPLGCRRICVDNSWTETLCSPTTEIVNQSVEKLTKKGVKSSDKIREHDVVIYATGFYNQRYFFPIKITGQNGTNISDLWKYNDKTGSTSPYSYLGVAVPDFPNFFVLSGPSTNPFNSIWLAIESQVGLIKTLIDHLTREQLSYCHPTPIAATEYDKELLNDFQSTVFSDPSCNVTFHENGWPNSWCKTYSSYANMLSYIDHSKWIFK